MDAPPRRYDRRSKGEYADRPDFSPDPPLTPAQLVAPRLQLSRMSITALLDAYYAAWRRCKNGAGWQASKGAIHPGTCAGLEGIKEGRVSGGQIGIPGDSLSAVS
jgi:hypothetical protein